MKRQSVPAAIGLARTDGTGSGPGPGPRLGNGLRGGPRPSKAIDIGHQKAHKQSSEDEEGQSDGSPLVRYFNSRCPSEVELTQRAEART